MMFTRFTEGARRAVVAGGIHALDAGRPALDAAPILLGLAEVQPFALKHFTADPAEVRRLAGLPDPRELLATLGIDLDEVHRRTRAGADDPRRWSLRRSRVRPLRLTLYGPLGSLPLTPAARKVVEVAKSRPGPVTGERLLWGLLADGTNGARRILRAAGVDVAALVREAAIPARRAA
ncbi:Clp protease N-terminal domain-containing protein [Nonomuraea sp. NPDC049309]|uniref:Clp protease N-terminal domain-containing protein n=1 Tax=Nonomuraea sp. NPDC049309 TaxID=3364350 RepID=UPI00370FCA9F